MEDKGRVMKRFLKAVDPKSEPRKITPDVINTFLSGVARETSGSTANKYRKVLLAAWRYGQKYHRPSFMGDNPVEAVEKFPEVLRRKHVPTLDDFHKALEWAKPGVRQLLLTMLHTGARKQELFRLTWDDVDLERGTICLWTNKRKNGNREFDIMPMTTVLWDMMRAMHERRKGTHVFCKRNGERFTARNGLLERLCERAHVERFTWHSIRHLAVSIVAARGGGGIATAQKFARHKTPRTTERYVHSLAPLALSVETAFVGEGHHGTDVGDERRK